MVWHRFSPEDDASAGLRRDPGGWPKGNTVASHALFTFSQGTGHLWITNDGNDARATLNTVCFGSEPTSREACLRTLFGALEYCRDEEQP